MLIAGGGTGGHLFPGIAVAEEVLTRRDGNEVLFVGTSRGIEAKVLPKLGYRLELIDVRGIKGTGLGSRLSSLFRLPKAVLTSIALVRAYRPDVAVGVGGYASGPAILAAWMLGVPCAVMEQNSVPGVTNRILGRFVRTVFITFPASAGFFPPRRVQLLGNPIRRQILDNFLEMPSRKPGRFCVLVLGGSQGAQGLNARVADAVEALHARGAGVRWLHQAGERQADQLRQRYASVQAEVETVAFIEDMSSAYRAADLVVCRAGATTLAELTVAKKASILVPFPHATDNHQELNARSIESVGAAIVVREAELDGHRLADLIQRLQGDPDQIARMERAAATAGRPEAAREIVDACEELTR
jgi:UDP-N-acetylglucosamine--N-acetylmuramyl-(pentapeptide) pyrophosphoryl-undecaprenol N-acetylglucosamine transferase